MQYALRVGLLLTLVSILGGCSFGLLKMPSIFDESDSAPSGLPDMSHVPDAVPKVERIYPYSLRPYNVLGKRYIPCAPRMVMSKKAWPHGMAINSMATKPRSVSVTICTQ
jgi:hypothetical protein